MEPNALHSDFVQFLNNHYGNCYTFNAHQPRTPRQYIERGGTDEGNTLSTSRGGGQKYPSLAEFFRKTQLVILTSETFLYDTKKISKNVITGGWVPLEIFPY